MSQNAPNNLNLVLNQEIAYKIDDTILLCLEVAQLN